MITKPLEDKVYVLLKKENIVRRIYGFVKYRPHIGQVWLPRKEVGQ